MHIKRFITPGNVADNNHDVIIRLTKAIFGKIFGDKGYLLAQEFVNKLQELGIQIITKVRSNMKERPISINDQKILKKRGAIESSIAILKENLSLEHTRHRSKKSFFGHIFSTLAAYAFREKKPSISVETDGLIMQFA